MKKIVLGLTLVLFILTFASLALAAKARPPRGTTSTATLPQSVSTSRGVKTSVKFRADRHGLLINFSGFENITSVTYNLSYTSGGVSQGVTGTITPESAGQQRELLFGTCSSGVCRYHSNIQNCRLVIDSKLKSGATVRKPYRIKI